MKQIWASALALLLYTYISLLLGTYNSAFHGYITLGTRARMLLTLIL
jgi:hypothetical protein